MDQALKQRLVGALVITALAAIFVPMFFEDSVDKSRRELDQSDLAIPAAPEHLFSEDNPIPKSPQQVLHAPEEEAAVATVAEAEEDSAELEEPAGEQTVSKEDDDPEQMPEETDAAAAAPPLAESAAETPAPLKSAQPKKLQAQQAAAPHPERRTQAKPAPAPTAQPVQSRELKRWVVQLGSFTKKANADSLVNKLRSQGFNAYGDAIQVADKGTMYRVRIGPELDKQRAQATQKKLQQMNGANSMLMTE